MLLYEILITTRAHGIEIGINRTSYPFAVDIFVNFEKCHGKEAKKEKSERKESKCLNTN